MIYSFELNEEETKFAENFAQEVGQSISELAKKFLLEDINDSIEAAKAWTEFENDPVTYTHEEIGQRLGLVS